MFRKVLAGLGLAGLLLATTVAPAAASGTHGSFRHQPSCRSVAGNMHAAQRMARLAYAHETGRNVAGLHERLDILVQCGLLDEFQAWSDTQSTGLDLFLDALIAAWYP